MTQRFKNQYRITFHGPTGKKEEKVVTADSQNLIDGVQDSLLSWTRLNKVVFSLPFNSFIHSELVEAPRLKGL